LRKDRQLADIGWLSIHVWEHEEPEEAAELIEDLWKSRIGRK
jgi:DNA mismatch endonuclease (patch repair protein)